MESEEAPLRPPMVRFPSERNTPDETVEVQGDPEHMEIAENMSQILRDYRRETYGSGFTSRGQQSPSGGTRSPSPLYTEERLAAPLPSLEYMGSPRI